MENVHESDGPTPLDLTVEELFAASQMLDLGTPLVLLQSDAAISDDESAGIARTGRRILMVRGLLLESVEGAVLDEDVATAVELLQLAELLVVVMTSGRDAALSLVCASDGAAAAFTMVGDGIWRSRFLAPSDVQHSITVLTSLDLVTSAEVVDQRSPVTLVAPSGATSEFEAMGAAIEEQLGSSASLHSVVMTRRGQVQAQDSVTWSHSSAKGLHGIAMDETNLILEPCSADDLAAELSRALAGLTAD